MRSPFVVTGKTWKEITAKVFDPITKLDRSLYKQFNLQDYGSGVNGIAVIFVIVKYNKSLHKDFTEWDQGTMELIIQHNLDYDYMWNLDEALITPELVGAYINCLEKALAETVIENFDYLQLLNDLKTYFLKPYKTNKDEVL